MISLIAAGVAAITIAGGIVALVDFSALNRELRQDREDGYSVRRLCPPWMRRAGR